MDTLLSIGYIFMNSILKNRRILPRARAVHTGQNFHFQKIKNKKILLHQRTIVKNKIQN